MNEYVLNKWKKIKKFAASSAKHSPVRKGVKTFLTTLDEFDSDLSHGCNYDLTLVAEADLGKEISRRYKNGKLSPMGSVFFLMEFLGLTKYQTEAFESCLYQGNNEATETSPDSQEVAEVIAIYKNGKLTDKDREALLLHLMGWNAFWVGCLEERARNLAKYEKEESHV